MKAELILTIPEVSMGENQWQRTHWAKRRKYQKLWDYLILVAKSKRWRGLEKFPKFYPFPIKKCTLKIIQHRKRLLDPDNLCVKPIIDALKHQNIIIEDDAKVITDLKPTQVKSKEQFTEIRIRAKQEGKIFMEQMVENSNSLT